MFLVAYSAGLCALLAPLVRQHNVVDLYVLASILVLGAPALVNGVIWLVENPGPERRRHLLLAIVLARLSKAVVVLGTCAAIWVFGWSDFPFFVRVEGRFWLVNFVAGPLWVVATCRLVWPLWNRRGHEERGRQFIFASILLVVAIGYRQLAPVLLDRDLVNLSRVLLTVALAGVILRMVPGRCPECRRRGVIRLPCRPPFAPHTTRPYKLSQCLACEIEYRDPRPSDP
jgi:cytochrome bd-type quinol oxidase subunit 2